MLGILDPIVAARGGEPVIAPSRGDRLARRRVEQEHGNAQRGSRPHHAPDLRQVAAGLLGRQMREQRLGDHEVEARILEREAVLARVDAPLRAVEAAAHRRVVKAQARIDAREVLLAPTHDVPHHVDAVVASGRAHRLAQRPRRSAQAAADVENAITGLEAGVIDQPAHLAAPDLDVVAAADAG